MSAITRYSDIPRQLKNLLPCIIFSYIGMLSALPPPFHLVNLMR